MKFILIILLGIATTSCFHKHYTGSGSLSQQERIVPYYNSIISEGSIDVYITKDTSYQVKVEAGKNVINSIETDVVNQQLIIRQNKVNVINEKPIRVFLSVDSLTYIELNGSGNFDAEQLNSSTLSIVLNGSGNADANINANTLNSSIDGSGNFDLLGNCQTYNGEIEGSGNISARYLYTQDCNFTIEGSGNGTVNVSNNLNANIYGSGNIIYYGNPSSVSSNIQGSGQIIQQ